MRPASFGCGTHPRVVTRLYGCGRSPDRATQGCGCGQVLLTNPSAGRCVIWELAVLRAARQCDKFLSVSFSGVAAAARYPLARSRAVARGIGVAAAVRLASSSGLARAI